ncbi:e3 ubiquitin-protein ligase RNF13 [Trichonephila clavipes]|nr:e3 ubiquitin-protein ligase RNF13 [Trichonephila clavipes]
MTSHTITPAVVVVCRCKAKEGLRRSPRGLRTQTRLSPLLRLNLDSSLKTTSFILLQSSFQVRGTTPNGGVDGWASKAAHVMGAAIPNVLQPGAFGWFEKTQGSLAKVLPVPGWRLMKQLAVSGYFL